MIYAHFESHYTSYFCFEVCMLLQKCCDISILNILCLVLYSYTVLLGFQWTSFLTINFILAVYSVVVDSFLIVIPIVRFCNYSMFCCGLLCVHSKAGCFALFVFLVLLDCCVALPHDATGCLQIVIVVFPDHSHLIF